MERTARRVRDFAAYLVIALAVGLGLIWFAYHSHGLRDDFIARWGGLALNTAILYGYGVKEGKPFWRIWGFWLATFSVLIFHLLAFSVILQNTDHWSTLFFFSCIPSSCPSFPSFAIGPYNALGGKNTGCIRAAASANNRPRPNHSPSPSTTSDQVARPSGRPKCTLSLEPKPNPAPQELRGFYDHQTQN